MAAGIVAATATDDGGIARLVAATASNLAAWHQLHVTALGHSARYADGLWLTSDVVPVVFFAAVAVRPGASRAALEAGVTRDAWVAVCDPWHDLELDDGYSIEGDHPWMVRSAGDVSAPGPGPLGRSGAPDASGALGASGTFRSPAGLVVSRVTNAEELADFERASGTGFGSPPLPAFTWHHPTILGDPRLALWRGVADRRTVASSMSFIDSGVVGVYSISTVPGARRRGFGRALTLAALSADPSLPCVLQPSAMAEALYASLGFQRFTTFRTWVRPTVPREGSRT